MTNRITDRPVFGLIAWLESTRVVLPLQGVECSFHVCGELVQVEIDQIFEQNNRQALDCIYSFPLPAGAAVYRCEMHVNGRVIRARVEEQQQARELARQKKEAGFRTALVEMERDNLFTLSLGNVQPGDVVVIRFAYFQTITRLGDWTSFRIPFCPGVRFIPGAPLLRSNQGRGAVDDTSEVPDASRISPPRIDKSHRDAPCLSVEGKVEHGPGITGLSSPTHPILVRPGEQLSSITLAELDAVPDSDFIVRWTENLSQELGTSGWASDDFALLRLRAPEEVLPPAEYGQNFYFLVDRSGSMAGLKWQKAVEAFRAFLELLGPTDRIWATFFDDSTRDFSHQPEPVANVKSDQVVLQLERLGTGGGTQLQPALAHIIKKIEAHSNGRPNTLILITDGEVGNESAILKSLAAHPELRVHVFGVDTTLNDGFLQKLAAQNHGTSCLVSPRDDMVGAVTRLGMRLRRPVLTQLRVGEGWEPATSELPDLHAAEVISLPLKRTIKGSSAAHEVVLEAHLADGKVQTYRLKLNQSDSEALPLLWARQRMDLLLAREDRTAALELAKRYNLVCEGAAFIAWDDSEKVPVSAMELYQPAQSPKMLACVLGAPPAARSMKKSSHLSDMLFGAWGESRLRLEEANNVPVVDMDLVDEPVQMTDLAGLVDKLRADTLFASTEAVEFLNTLKEWIRAHPIQLTHCVAALAKLMRELSEMAGKPPARRLKAVRRWVKKHLEEPSQIQALRQLDALEAGGKTVIG